MTELGRAAAAAVSAAQPDRANVPRLTAGLKPEGSLAERDFPDLIQALHEGRWTGLLTLTHVGVGRRVRVEQGRLVFASSSSPDDRLGELLLRRGKITYPQFDNAAKEIVPGKRLGTILVERGVLTPKDLVKAVVDQTQEIIYACFQWTEGRYRLEEGAGASEAITLKISTPDLIMEGIRRIEAWSRVLRAVGGLDTRYERTPDYEKMIRFMTLSFEKLQVLTELNGTQTVERICSECTLPDFEICRTLWAYRVLGVIRRIDQPEPRRALVEDDGLGFVLAGG